jgi:DNA-binding transcriptional ArsR family regulator
MRAQAVFALANRRAELAPVLAALGDERRLQIVDRLCDQGPQSIAHLTRGSRISRQAVTKHLATLENAGILASHRIGRQRIWQIRASRLEDAREYLKMISSQWEEAIARLRGLVEARA